MKDFVRLFRYLRPFRKLMALSLALMFAGALFTLLTPWPLKLLFDNVLGNHPLPAAIRPLLGPLADDRVHLLIFLVLAGLGVAIAHSGLSVLDSYVNSRIEQSMILDMRTDIFRHVLSLSMPYHDQRRSGMLIYAINNEAAAAALVVSEIPPLLQSAITLVGMIWITFRIEWHLALLSMVVLPILYSSVSYYIKRIQPRLLEVKMLEGESLSIVHEVISMLRVVVAFNRETHELRRFRHQGQRAVDARVKLTVRQTLFSLGVNTTTAIGTALVLGFGAYYVLTQRMTSGDLLVIFSYVGLMYTPLETISNTLGSLQDQLVSLRVAFRVQDTEPEIADSPDALILDKCQGRIAFRGVHFTYKARATTLKDISFEAEPAEVIALVGPTGAGKTTLVSLIARFYEANEGAVLVDGIDVRDISLTSLRRNVSVVLQEPLLFSGTIADNIRYGRLEATMDEIIAAARAANAHDFIMDLPAQYSTDLGERGAQISGGERQRIAVARAFLKDAPILILDEPTSSIDSKTEATILDALEQLMIGRTTFIVAHRLSTVRHADRILVLDHGELVEQGTHAQLLRQGGLYKQLHDTQNRPDEGDLDADMPCQDAMAPPMICTAPNGGDELVRTPVGPTEPVPTVAAATVIPRPKIIVLGMMSKIPVPGVIWQIVHYLVGFERLGYDAYYVEQHGRTPSMLMEREEDDSSALAAGFISGVLKRFDLGDRWALHALHADGRYYGMTEAQVRDLYRSAAVIINMHGGTQPLPEHSATGRLVYLETDPVALQVELHEGRQETIDFLSPHCAFFTFAENMGNADCGLPVSGKFPFRPTRQPVITDLWRPFRGAPGHAFTTIGNWQQPWREVAFNGSVYHWSKHYEFLKFLDLPTRTGQSFELALSSYAEADRRLLEEHGWKVRPALDFSTDIDAYRRYIAASRGEFTVAKDQNVRLRSGWFSDRSATYLAAGRPVITQETGFSNALPTGRGLFAFSGMEEIEAALDRINAAYEDQCAAAFDVAREFFSYDVVLPQLLHEVGIAPTGRKAPKAADAPPVADTVGGAPATDANRDAPADASARPFPPGLLLRPVSRWPVVLPPDTVAAIEAAPTPVAASRYDVIWVGRDSDAATRAVMDDFAAEGNRVFRVAVDPSLAPSPEPFRVRSADDGCIRIVVPAQPGGEGDDRPSLAALEALRSAYAIHAAVVWAEDPPAWRSALGHARRRWGWRTLHDITRDDQLRDATDGGSARPPRPDTPAPPPKGREEIDRAVRAAFPTVSVVIVAFNNLVYTKLCIGSVLANTDYPAYELVVVDNGSSDDTGAYVRELVLTHPHIRAVSHRENLGFARAVNKGVAVSSGDVIVLLNNDTVVPRGWLARLARHLEDPSIGMVGPVTNHAGNEAQIEAPYETYGDFLRFSADRSYGHEAELSDIPMLTMFCVALRREVFREIGPLDEDFQIGMFEDDDYAMRVRAAGYRIVCAEDVHVHHIGQVSVATWSETGDYGALFRANRARYERKWGVQWRPHARRQDVAYDDVVREIRCVADASLPLGATLAVISKGDENLLALDGRTAWHFPRADDGVYAGHYPSDSDEATAHLEALRARGAEFLLIPAPSAWWLDYYDAFGRHLKRHYPIVADRAGVCRIYALHGRAHRDASGGRPVAAAGPPRGGMVDG